MVWSYSNEEGRRTSVPTGGAPVGSNKSAQSERTCGSRTCEAHRAQTRGEERSHRHAQAGEYLQRVPSAEAMARVARAPASHRHRQVKTRTAKQGRSGRGYGKAPATGGGGGTHADAAETQGGGAEARSTARCPKRSLLAGERQHALGNGNTARAPHTCEARAQARGGDTYPDGTPSQPG